MDDKKPTTEQEWRDRLTPEAYHVLRENGTERAFTGELYTEKGSGQYRCAGCGTLLFSSETKFESGSGWPSFSQPVDDNAGSVIEDRSHGMVRTEYRCGNCNGHLGHIFPDGPGPTGQRFCINSAALDFVPEKATTTK